MKAVPLYLAGMTERGYAGCRDPSSWSSPGGMTNKIRKMSLIELELNCFRCVRALARPLTNGY